MSFADELRKKTDEVKTERQKQVKSNKKKRDREAKEALYKHVEQIKQEASQIAAKGEGRYIAVKAVEFAKAPPHIQDYGYAASYQNHNYEYELWNNLTDYYRELIEILKAEGFLTELKYWKRVDTDSYDRPVYSGYKLEILW